MVDEKVKKDEANKEEEVPEEQVTDALRKLVFEGRLTERVDWLKHKILLQIISSKDNSSIEKHERLREFLPEERQMGSLAYFSERFKLILSYAVLEVDGTKQEDPKKVLEFLDVYSENQIATLMQSYTDMRIRENKALDVSKLEDRVKN